MARRERGDIFGEPSPVRSDIHWHKIAVVDFGE
jgi:hypothetical protein